MRTNLAITATFVLAASVAAGCGNSNSNDTGASDLPSALTATQPAPATTTATTAQPATASHAVTVKMTEFAFSPKDAVAKAGKVKISAPNEGTVKHELVLLKTDVPPAQLPKKGGKVDESTSVGEIADVEPGKTKKNTLNLKAGKYAMVCALPGHYEGGMYGSLTVK
ncbi:MAG: hypothetical protein QOE08_596 [Thermoleophilaceae bacterium]|nr:hypothetical protein [Thermoleophilaceae bacterium]